MMKTLIIEVHKDAGQLKMSSFLESEMMVHRQYIVKELAEETVKSLCDDIFAIINRTDADGKVTGSSLEELRKSAHLLFNQILSQEIRERIAQTDATHIVFHIDEGLVHIPWELLHDGTDYLSLRFATGRIILTSRHVHTDILHRASPRLKMLAVCDPTCKLRKSYEEGVAIRNQLDKSRNRIKIELRTTDVDVMYTLKNITECDIFHFAGHTSYDLKNPSKSGLMLKDGELTAENIAALGSSFRMPFLVIVNGCSSGETASWRIAPDEEKRIYGLANAFLLSGVKHYIGTFWKVPDGLSMYFSSYFYRYITMGTDIGQAVRFARLKMIEKFGKNTLIWASYMLYGDPTEPVIRIKKGFLKIRGIKLLLVLGLFAALLALVFTANRDYIKDSEPSAVIHFDLLKDVFYVKQNGAVERYDQMNIFSNNTAIGKPAYASSVQDPRYAANYAVDGNLSTRWSSAYSDRQWIYIDLEKVMPIGQVHLIWEMAYAASYELQVSSDGKKWKTVWRTTHSDGGHDAIDLRDKEIAGRYIRLCCEKRTTEWGYSLWEFEAYPAMWPNIALNKSVFASSAPEGYDAKNVVDGNKGTRWTSDPSDPQWIYVNLGRPYLINAITLYWNDAYGAEYKIQYSDDAKTWKDTCLIRENHTKENNIYFESPFTARYLRIYGLKSTLGTGYSIWELEIHGASF